MKTFLAFMKKEMMEQRRSGKLIILCILFMLLGIMKAYQAETLRVSEGCVREGYLLTHFR